MVGGYCAAFLQARQTVGRHVADRRQYATSWLWPSQRNSAVIFRSDRGWYQGRGGTPVCTYEAWRFDVLPNAQRAAIRYEVQWLTKVLRVPPP